MTSRLAGPFALVFVLATMPGARASVPAPLDPAYVRHVHLVRPDGLPAAGAIVTARVARHGDETGHYTPYVYTANVAGDVTIAIPPDDPIIVSQPQEHLFDIEAFVQNGGPGVQTPYTTPQPAWSCITTTWPQSLQTVTVPVAPNFGAGADMRLAVTYQNSHSTISSKNVGSDGFFAEVLDSSTFGTNASVRGLLVRNGVQGGTSDETLRVSAQYKIDKIVMCTSTGDYPECDDYSTVGPDHMVGVLTTGAGASFHDTMKSGGVANEDCGYYLNPGDEWNNSQGVTKDLAWTQGFDYQGDWKVANFHATTTWTTYSQDRDSTSYRWSNQGTTYRYHYVFVPGGNRGYDPNQPNGGATCPITDPGGTYTDASNDGCKTVEAPCDMLGPATGGLPDPEEPAKQIVRRCEQAPERCGRE